MASRLKPETKQPFIELSSKLIFKWNQFRGTGNLIYSFFYNHM